MMKIVRSTGFFLPNPALVPDKGGNGVKISEQAREFCRNAEQATKYLEWDIRASFKKGMKEVVVYAGGSLITGLAGVYCSLNPLTSPPVSTPCLLMAAALLFLAVGKTGSMLGRHTLLEQAKDDAHLASHAISQAEGVASQDLLEKRLGKEESCDVRNTRFYVPVPLLVSYGRLRKHCEASPPTP